MSKTLTEEEARQPWEIDDPEFDALFPPTENEADFKYRRELKAKFKKWKHDAALALRASQQEVEVFEKAVRDAEKSLTGEFAEEQTIAENITRIRSVLAMRNQEIASLRSDKERLEKEIADEQARSLDHALQDGILVASLRSDLEQARKAIRENCFDGVRCIFCKEAGQFGDTVKTISHKPDCIILSIGG